MAALMALAERAPNAQLGSIVDRHTLCPRLRWRSHGGISQDVIIGEDGIFIGITSFGASAPDTDVYNYFNVSPEAVAEAPAPRCNS